MGESADIDDDLVPKAIDRVLKRSSEVGFDKLTDAEKTFLCAVTVDFEVLNGGFSAFYYNSDGEIVAATPDALEAIGAAQSAAVIREANALFPGGVPAHDRAERYEQIEGFSKAAQNRLDELDRKFGDLDEIFGALLPFVKKHRDEL